MILLDTHAWVWWVHGDSRLAEEHREMLDAAVVAGIAVSIISCWEVAKLDLSTKAFSGFGGQKCL